MCLSGLPPHVRNRQAHVNIQSLSLALYLAICLGRYLFSVGQISPLGSRESTLASFRF